MKLNILLIPLNIQIYNSLAPNTEIKEINTGLYKAEKTCNLIFVFLNKSINETRKPIPYEMDVPRGAPDIPNSLSPIR